jgi:hypothetical protein
MNLLKSSLTTWYGVITPVYRKGEAVYMGSENDFVLAPGRATCMGNVFKTNLDKKNNVTKF